MQVIYGKKFHRIGQIPYLYIDYRETQRREFRKWVQTVHEDASDECTGTMSRSNSAFTMSLMTSNLRGNHGQNRYLMMNLEMMDGSLYCSGKFHYYLGSTNEGNA